jgi:hypothetical protein
MIFACRPVTAKALAEAGCESVKDIQRPKYHKMLTRAQQIGLQYFTDLQQPLLRSEAEIVLVSPCIITFSLALICLAGIYS